MSEHNEAAPPSALRLDRLALRNFRCFDSLEIDFHPQLTVLVANNGRGKTAVLDAIATALGPFVGAFDDGKDRSFSRDDIRMIRVGTGNRMELADGGVSLQAEGMAGFESVQWARQLSGPKAKTTRKEAKSLAAFGARLQSEVRREADMLSHTGTCLPLVAYYGTDRLWNRRRLPYKPLPKTSRMVGYTHCLESGSDYHLMAEWFRYWSTNVLLQRLKAQERGESYELTAFDSAIEVVVRAVDRCLAPSGWERMAYSPEREEIVAQHPEQGTLPLALLSDGIRSMLTLVADIAFRAAQLNPNLGPFAAEQVHGVVLVDEVDMHLHPEWQQSVLSSLREAFPKVQFIVTTHSPQVLSTVEKECVRVLGRDASGDLAAAMPLASTYGEESGNVLQAVMHVNPMPPVSERKDLERLAEWVDQGAYRQPEAVALFDKLIGALGEAHPRLLALRRSIERQERLKEGSSR